MNKVIMVKCPTCEKQFSYYTSEFRPFCCEKCKLIDLGHWFKESYKVPSKEGEIQKDENVNHDENTQSDDDNNDPSEYL